MQFMNRLRRLTPNEGKQCVWLFAALVVTHVVAPFAADAERVSNVSSASIGALLYTGILLTGLLTLRRLRRHTWLVLLAVVPALVLNWLTVSLPFRTVAVLSAISFALFLGILLVVLLSYVLNDEKVTADKLFGASAAYFLIAHFWGMLYYLVALGDAEAFVGIETLDPNVRSLGVLYYSFVTLTTLGYGDILPVSLKARSLATLEATVGVLYTVVLVARLVGLYLAAEEER